MRWQEHMEKCLAEPDQIVHVFTDDPEYQKYSAHRYAQYVAEQRWKFGPHDEYYNMSNNSSVEAGKECRFKRVMPLKETLVQFAAMAFCDQVAWTAGSTVKFLVKAIRERGLGSPSLEEETIGDWPVPDMPTKGFQYQMKHFLHKAANYTQDRKELRVTHEQQKVIDFLSDNHLDEIYACMKKKIEETPGRSVKGSDMGQHLIKNVSVARINRTKFGQMPANKQENQHWLKALIKSALKNRAIRDDRKTSVITMSDAAMVEMREKAWCEFSGSMADSPASSSEAPWKRRRTEK